MQHDNYTLCSHELRETTNNGHATKKKKAQNMNDTSYAVLI